MHERCLSDQIDRFYQKILKLKMLQIGKLWKRYFLKMEHDFILTVNEIYENQNLMEHLFQDFGHEL